MKVFRVLSCLMIFFFATSVIPMDFAEARRSSSRSSRSYSRPKPAPRAKVRKQRVRTPPPARKKIKKKSVASIPSSSKGKKGIFTPPKSGKKKGKISSVPSSSKKKGSIASIPPSGSKGKKGVSTPPKAMKRSIVSRIPQNAADKAALKKRAQTVKTKKAQIRNKFSKAKNLNANSIKTQKASYYKSHNYRHNRRIESYDTGFYDPGFITMMALTGAGSDHPLFWASMSRNPWFTYWLLNSKNSADKEEKKRLAQIEKDIAEVKASGKAIPADYIPAEIPATVALKADVLIPEEVVMYTASQTGFYNEICEKAKANANEYGMKWNCKPTAGGEYNIKQFVAGNAKTFMAQADNIYSYQKKGIKFPENQFVTHQEPMWIITKRKSKIKNIEDIGKKTTVYAMGGAYSSWKTLSAFAKDDTGIFGFGGNDDYVKAKLEKFDSKNLKTIAGKVAKDKNAVIFVVMGVDAKFLKNFDKKYGKDLRLAPINDDRFTAIADPDGKRIYSECDVEKATLPNLQAGKFWGQNSVHTICVDAIWVIDDSLSSDTMTLILTDTIDEL